MPDFPRRRLLTALACSPLLSSLPLRAADSVKPALDLSRIIAIEWLPIELLLTLGVTPLGVAEVYAYRNWVVEPAIPATSIDVGLRTEPNMELITELQPSLVLRSQGYGPGASLFTDICPTLAFSFNDGRTGPLASARTSLMSLAHYIGREAQAQQHLTEFDAFLTQMKTRLAGRTPRPLLLMSLMDDRHTLVFGHGSLFLDVMTKLGLPNAWQGETNFWGSAVIGIERLAEMEDVDAICFSHGDDDDMARLSQTPLWQSMPFVRQKRFKRIPGIWFYGATLSAMRFCHLLDGALEAA